VVVAVKWPEASCISIELFSSESGNYNIVFIREAMYKQFLPLVNHDEDICTMIDPSQLKGIGQA
jgi:hypothetical protein